MGTTSYQVSRSDYNDFTLKCVVTDSNNDTFTAIHNVSVSGGVERNQELFEDKITEKEITFKLGNYPNPFNPTTKISFAVPKSGFVSLKVYNILGKEIATLSNGTLQAGTYEFEFDASELPSGTYIYNLSTEQENISKKMLLIK